MVARGSGTGLPARRERRRPGGVRTVGLGLTALGVLFTLGGCDVGRAFKGFGWPEEGVTPQANKMYDLWVGSVVAALAVGFFVWGLIFWCIIRYRKRGDELPAQTRFNLPIELIYTVVPFLAVAVLFYYTAVVQTYVEKRSANPDVKVEVAGFKWNWQFRYLDESAKGADGQQITTKGATDYIPVLVVPTGERIRFYQTSKDVIHSFWVPELLFKRDVFPGNVRNEFEVTIEKEGAYVGRCAELCGAYHSMMNFEVRAVSPDKYDRFIAARKEGLTTPQALSSIGEPPLAVKTHPFDTDPTKRSAS